MPLLVFKPSPELEELLLERLASPNYSITTIAADHDTTLEAFTLWATSPDIQQRLRRLEDFAASRARHAATQQLHGCVEALTAIVHACTHEERKVPLPNTNDGEVARDRRRSGARRAAWLLLRIARFFPATAPNPGAVPLGLHPPTSIPATNPTKRRDISLPQLSPTTSNRHAEVDALIAAIAQQTPDPIAAPNPGAVPLGLHPPTSTPATTITTPPVPPSPRSPGRGPEALRGGEGLSPSDDPDPIASSASPSRPPETSASTFLSTRSVFDTPVTDPHAPTLADTAETLRALDPARPYEVPWQVPDHHKDRLQPSPKPCNGCGPKPHNSS